MAERTGNATPKAGSKRRPFEVKVKHVDARFEIWLCPDGDTPELAGMINARLATDARFHGQDLVEELVEQALKQGERRHELGRPGQSRVR
jgi:hypothetical protein